MCVICVANSSIVAGIWWYINVSILERRVLGAMCVKRSLQGKGALRPISLYIQGRNHSDVNFAANSSWKMEILWDTSVFILEKNRTSVMYVPKPFLSVVHSHLMLVFTQVRNPLNVKCVAKSSRIAVTLWHIAVPTQEKSRTSVKFVRKCFHGGQFWQNTNVHTTETKLTLTHTKSVLFQALGCGRSFSVKNLEAKFPRLLDTRMFK